MTGLLISPASFAILYLLYQSVIDLAHNDVPHNLEGSALPHVTGVRRAGAVSGTLPWPVPILTALSSSPGRISVLCLSCLLCSLKVNFRVYLPFSLLYLVVHREENTKTMSEYILWSHTDLCLNPGSAPY